MERHDVGLGEQLFERHQLDAGDRRLGNVWIAGDDAHAECLGDDGDT